MYYLVLLQDTEEQGQFRHNPWKFPQSLQEAQHRHETILSCIVKVQRRRNCDRLDFSSLCHLVPAPHFCLSEEISLVPSVSSLAVIFEVPGPTLDLVDLLP